MDESTKAQSAHNADAGDTIRMVETTDAGQEIVHNVKVVATWDVENVKLDDVDDTEELDGVEYFHVSAAEFANAEDGSWQADRLAEYMEDGSSLDEACKALAGYYYWSCQIGCIPDSEAYGPFASENEAKQDAFDNWGW